MKQFAQESSEFSLNQISNKISQLMELSRKSTKDLAEKKKKESF